MCMIVCVFEAYVNDIECECRSFHLDNRRGKTMRDQFI